MDWDDRSLPQGDVKEEGIAEDGMHQPVKGQVTPKDHAD